MTSSPEYQLIISSDFYEDLKDISAYTYKTWGAEQNKKYYAQVFEKLDRLTRNPSLGHWRDDLPEGYKAYAVGQHLILFREENDIFYISRIIHQNRLILAEL